MRKSNKVLQKTLARWREGQDPMLRVAAFVVEWAGADQQEISGTLAESNDLAAFLELAKLMHAEELTAGAAAKKLKDKHDLPGSGTPENRAIYLAKRFRESLALGGDSLAQHAISWAETGLDIDGAGLNDAINSVAYKRGLAFVYQQAALALNSEADRLLSEIKNSGDQFTSCL
jgi:hypothetical protein